MKSSYKEGRIKACLESIKWADEVIVLDNGSTDKTLDFAKSYTDKIFLFYAMILAEKKWKLLEQGSTFTAANSTQIAEFPLIIAPTIEEQTTIALILADMDAEINILKGKLNKYKFLRQGMMQILLTGKVRLT